MSATSGMDCFDAVDQKLTAIPFVLCQVLHTAHSSSRTKLCVVLNIATCTSCSMQGMPRVRHQPPSAECDPHAACPHQVECCAAAALHPIFSLVARAVPVTGGVCANDWAVVVGCAMLRLPEAHSMVPGKAPGACTGAYCWWSRKDSITDVQRRHQL